MKRWIFAILMAGLVAFSLTTAEAAKVCVEHNGDEGTENILINESAVDTHVNNHGDSIVAAENCIDNCVMHKGNKAISVSDDELQEHLDHGDEPVPADQCL